jgi:hypothetical protein
LSSWLDGDPDAPLFNRAESNRSPGFSDASHQMNCVTPSTTVDQIWSREKG